MTLFHHVLYFICQIKLYLQQHVHQPTHYCGHTLDVLMSRDNSTIVSNSEVKDIGLCDDNGKLIKSHFAITCELQHRRIPVNLNL